MKRKMIYAGLSYIAGLFFASIFSFKVQIPVMLSLMLTGSVICLLKKIKFTYYALCTLFFLSGAVYNTVYNQYIYDKIVSYDNVEIYYSGTVDEIKRYSDNRCSYILSGKINSETNAMLICYTNTDNVDYGDVMSFKCKPEKFENTWFFKQKDYYESRGIYLVTYNISECNIVNRDNFSLKRIIFHYRDYIKSRINRILPGDNGALISAMLSGDKSSLDDTASDALYKCGTGHMLAVSGMHLVLAVSFITVFIKRMKIPGYLKFFITETVIIVFVIFSGMSVSVVRAAFMLTLIYGAELFGRQNDSFNSLCIAALILLIREPYLIKNSSFLLSAAGTFGAAVFAPYITADMKDETFLENLRKKMMTVFCISCSVFPFSVLFFDEASLISPVSDIIIIPLCTCAMLCGLVTAIFGGLSIIAYPALIIGGLASKAVIKISLFFASSGFSAMPLGLKHIPMLTAVLFGFVLFTAVKFKNKTTLAIALVISAGVMLLSLPVYRFINRDIVSVYRIGNKKAVSIVIEKNGKADIIDISGNSKNSEYVSKLIKRQGIDIINSIFFMKNPYQSMSAFSDAFELINVRHVYFPESIYISEDTLICGCIPEYISADGIKGEYKSYSIETDISGQVKVISGETEIVCTKSEIVINNDIPFKDLNIAVRTDNKGNYDINILE